MTVDTTDNGKVDVPSLAEFITAQSSNADCRAAFAPTGNASTPFNVENDGFCV